MFLIFPLCSILKAITKSRTCQILILPNFLFLPSFILCNIYEERQINLFLWHVIDNLGVHDLNALKIFNSASSIIFSEEHAHSVLENLNSKASDK